MQENTPLSNAKWTFLCAVAKEMKTPAELAQITKTSAANAYQQISLLEAHKHVIREDDSRQGPGKPTSKFGLATPYCFLSYCTKHTQIRKKIQVDHVSATLLNILASPHTRDYDALLHFLYAHSDIVKYCQGIYLTKSTPENIELFIITDKLKEIRDHKSNIPYTDIKGKKRAIIIWSHSKKEIIEGLARHEDYFIQLCKQAYLIREDEGLLQEVREHIA